MWVLAVVFGLVGSTLQAQRSPRFDYFYMEAAKSFRNDEMGAALELFSHCMEIDSTAAEALFSMSVFYLYALDEDSVGRLAAEILPTPPISVRWPSIMSRIVIPRRWR